MRRLLLFYILAVSAVIFFCGRVSFCAEIDDQLSLDAIEDVQFIDKIDKAKAADDKFAEIPEKVSPDHWAYQAVKSLVEAKLLEDTPSNAFRNNKTVTKQELVKRLEIVYERRALEFDPTDDSKFEKYVDNNTPALPYKRPDDITPTVNSRPNLTTPQIPQQRLPGPSEILSLKGSKILSDRDLQEMPLDVSAQGRISPPDIPEPGPLTIPIPPPAQQPAVIPISALLNEGAGTVAPVSRWAPPEGWNLAPNQVPQTAVPIPVPKQTDQNLEFDFPAPTPTYTPPPPDPDVYIPFPDPTQGVSFRVLPSTTPAAAAAPVPQPTVESATKLPNRSIRGTTAPATSAATNNAKKEKINDDPAPGSTSSSDADATSEKSSDSASKKSSKTKKEDKEEKESKPDDSKEKDSKEKDKKAKAVKVPKEFDKLSKKVELDEKDAEVLAAIVDYVEKDVIKKTVDKDIGEVKKIAQRNERDIEKLEQDNQRYKVTGSGEISYQTTNYLNSTSSASVGRSFGFDLYSKPRKFDDMILRTSLTSTSNDLRLQYQNFNVDKANPRNFKMRALTAGYTSFGASPLTIFGSDIDGFTSELNFNDYSIKLMAGKKRNNSNFLVHAASLQFNLFNEPRSWIYITRIFNKYKSSYGEDDWGQWVNGDGALKDPSYKNGVNSVYIRYPMPVKGVYLTADYAHSTYYRKGFKLAFPVTNELYDKYDAACYDNCKSSFDSPNDYQVQLCKQQCQTYSSWDNFWDNYNWDWGDSYKSETGWDGWIPIPELKDQDDAFAVLLDYTSGPLSIFPLGYINLGPGFVSKSLGLPGLDASTLSLDMIPINLQSLEAWLARGEFKKTEDNYKIEFLAAKVNETEPMFLDTSAFDSSMKTLMTLNLLARINNRDKNTVLKVDLAQTKLSYYLTDNVTFSGDFMKVKAGIPPACIDSNITRVQDDFGNTISSYIGNGITDCEKDGDLSVSLFYKMRTQKYNMYWKTSKKSDLSIDYNIEDSQFSAVSREKALVDAVENLIDSGRKYYMSYHYKYKLTDVSNVELWMNKNFGRPDISKAHPDAELKHNVGIKMNMSF